MGGGMVESLVDTTKDSADGWMERMNGIKFNYKAKYKEKFCVFMFIAGSLLTLVCLLIKSF